MRFTRSQFPDTTYETNNTRYPTQEIDVELGVISRIKQELIRGTPSIKFRSTDPTRFKRDTIAGVLGTLLYERNHGETFSEFDMLRIRLLKEIAKLSKAQNH